MNITVLKQISDNFTHELHQSLTEKTSLPFIRHKLSKQTLINKDEIFQVIVVGGSFYQKALMQKVDGDLKIIKYDQGPQPPFLTENHLMKFIEKHLDPEVKVVALNFAYPLLPKTRGNVVDGMLHSGSKENTFIGLVGRTVGENVEKYVKEIQGKEIKVAAGNDTICLLLSGLVHHSWNHIAAGVDGTGLNFALFLNEQEVVNLEAANFDKFTQSEAGREIDKNSVSPGDALFEKEVSGAYLYKHFNFEAKQQNLQINPIKSTKELEALLRGENEVFAKLARDVINHSASLVAAQIAGILNFCKRDLTFIMQGSLYWKGYKYKDTVEKLVIDLTPQYHASFERILHSDIFGAAKLIA